MIKSAFPWNVGYISLGLYRFKPSAVVATALVDKTEVKGIFKIAYDDVHYRAKIVQIDYFKDMRMAHLNAVVPLDFASE